jgi:hypothetical protein
MVDGTTGWATSRAQEEATAFALSDTFLKTLKLASRHDCNWISPVLQTRSVSKLVSP